MGWELVHQVDKIKNELMAELFVLNFPADKIMFVKTDVVDVEKTCKKM